MSDLISRSKIHDYIQMQINPYGKPFEGTAYELGLKIMDYIKNMSTVKPVRGEWETHDKYSGICFCSNCGQEAYWDTEQDQQLFDFCPYCGSQMKKEVTE